MKSSQLAFFGVLCGTFVFFSATWTILSRVMLPSSSSEPQVSAADFVRELPLALPGILETIYRAYDEVDEGRIYDLLAQVAEDEALEVLYLERMASVDRAGLSASQKIHEVQVVSLSARVRGASVDLNAQWRVLGTVGHAEHMHMRGNAYTAELVMEPRDDGWRIVGFSLLDIDRSEVGQLEQHSLEVSATASPDHGQP